MAGLKGIVLARETVPVPGGGSVDVRGLSYSDIRSVFELFPQAASKFFDIVSDQGAGTAVNNAGIAVALMKELPEVAAALIAHASDEPESLAVALTLPIPVQTDLLVAIGKLTFATEGGAKKFLQTVTSLFNSVNAGSLTG
jgi:hypothetical protein